jgi:hypothetical protein
MRTPQQAAAIVVEVWTDPETLATCSVSELTDGTYIVDVSTDDERVFTETYRSLFAAMTTAEALRRIEESCSPRYYAQAT